MKKAISLLLSLGMVLALAAGCGNKTSPTPDPAPAVESNTPVVSVAPKVDNSKALNIMFVVTGSLGGGNNVDDVKAALDEYVATYGGSVQTFECNMDTSIYQAQLEAAAEDEKYDLIVTGFSTMVEPLCNVAKEFPEQKFFLFDAAVDFTSGDYSNVISAQARGNEGGFLAGALAALMTKSADAERANDSKTIGFVGGLESTAILDFMFGYVEGAKYVDPKTEVLYSFVGNQNDSALTQEIARSQNQSGADVIFAATNSDLAVADVALESDFYAICCDADEAARIADSNLDEANHILTSVIKDYKGMVAPMLVQIGEGSAKWGEHTYIRYSEGGVNVPENEWFNNQVPASVLAEYEAIVADMAADKIEVSTAYGAGADVIDSFKELASSK